jgi:uridine kinase
MHQVCRPLELVWSDLTREKIFQIGIFIKFLLIIGLLPIIQKEWFVPFILNWIENPISIPWSNHLEFEGDPLAFPYGPIMFISHLPTTAIGWAIDNLFSLNYFAHFGFRLSLLFADIFLLILLLQVFENHWRKVLIYYWLSPLVIFITYWHGQTDLIPVALFIYSLALIKRRNFWLAGIILAFAIGAKHSMIIGVPFIILYLWSHNGINKELQRFLTYFIASLFIVEAPFLISESFRLMVLGNREVAKLYWLYIEMGEMTKVYLTPVVYIFLLYFFWRIRRINFDLLMAAMGVAFSIIIIMTPSPPGWFLWLVPIFILHQSRYGMGAVAIISLFSFLFITYHLTQTSGANLFFFDLSFFQQVALFNNTFFQSIHYTCVVGSGLLIAIQILREGVRENDYYRLGTKPLVLGIAGDSGVGKSTFSKRLACVFGEQSIAEISGDDYHNWERSSPMWRTLTHLDPKANRLFELVKDVRGLISGEVVRARHYDHHSGRFLPQKIKKSKDIILVEGLHTLYPRQLLEELDVSFFIEMDESLRSYLRIKRDTKVRGHLQKEVISDLKNRKNDSVKYIKPQSDRADVIFTLLLINKELFDNEQIVNSNIKLSVSIRNGIYYQELVRILIGVCGLQVNIESVDERGEVVLEISGDVDSEDVGLAINILAPHVDELLDFSSKFSSGIDGIMQIITVIEIDEALRRRRVV